MPSGWVKAMEPPLEKRHMMNEGDDVDGGANNLLWIYLAHRYLQLLNAVSELRRKRFVDLMRSPDLHEVCEKERSK
jgi:hypothetical protein